MVEIPFLALEALFTLIWLACRIAVWRRQGGIDWKREAVLLLMYVNLAVIIRFTFFPLALENGHVRPLLFDPAEILPFNTNLVPFARLRDYYFRADQLVNVVGNIAMFIPSGIVLPIVYKRLDCFWKVVGTGALMSLGIEILQLPFFTRTTDIDDLIFNTAGVAIGYGIYALVRRMRSTQGAMRPWSRA